MKPVEIRAVTDRNRAEAVRFHSERWGSDRMVSGGRVWSFEKLDGFTAVWNGKIAGAVTDRFGDGACEVVSLDSALKNRGIGTALLDAAVRAARKNGCRRVFLLTTNDNTRALRFCQKRGFDIAGFFRNSIETSRKIKPEIPLTGNDGIPVRHEIELDLPLRPVIPGG